MRTHFYQMSSFDGFEYLEAIENTSCLSILTWCSMISKIIIGLLVKTGAETPKKKRNATL